jgi:hypothetical protein
VNNRVRTQGFLSFDYADRFPQIRAEPAGWIESGVFAGRTTVYEGLSEAPRVFVDLLAGRTVAITVVTMDCGGRFGQIRRLQARSMHRWSTPLPDAPMHLRALLQPG